MRLFAGLLITACLVLGTIAGTTAYLPKVTSIDPADKLLLAAPAGVSPDDPRKPLLDPTMKPIVLTADVLDQLSKAKVRRVRVKSFAFKRWTHRYLFLLSCVGLVAGAYLVRREEKRHVNASADSPKTASPEQLLRDALSRIQSLRQNVTHSDAAQARTQIVGTLDELMRTQFDGFVESRSLLMGRLGMAGYARLMDRFAAAERQFNRAWSAAADHVMEESIGCLADGEIRLQEALEQLKR